MTDQPRTLPDTVEGWREHDARPRTPDPMSAPSLGWGVIGTGWIAERFVGALQRNTRQRVVAVASRGAGRAAAVAGALGIGSSYGSYEELVDDPAVDVVYVATGHADHVPCARLALEHGKPVLVEKPLALTASDAEGLVRLAEREGLFLAEAMWTMFLPRFDVVRQVLESGALGRIDTVLADNGESFPPGHRILRAEDHGGPMLDLGTYPVAFATWVTGEPAAVVASAQPHPSGVTGQVAAVLTTASGVQCVVHTSVLGDTPVTASISGSGGLLTLPGPFYMPGDVTLTPRGGTPFTIHTEPRTRHEALFWEAAEVARCIDSGRTGTPLRTAADTLATLRAMDEINARCGLG